MEKQSRQPSLLQKLPWWGVYIVFSKLISFSLGLVSPECETVPVPRVLLVPAVEVQALAWP